MPDFRYAQFCPLARAAEIVGERWTLLVVRELLLGPKRFSDLKAPLAGISSSVLAERLARLEARGVVSRRELPPPAPATVYELTEVGRALEPALLALTRWGGRFLSAPEAHDHVEPSWVRLGLQAFARRDATPARSIDITVEGDGAEVRFNVRGGPRGAVVAPHPLPAGAGGADASVRGPTLVVMGVMAGAIDPREAMRSGALRAEGEVDAVVDLPAMFDMTPLESKGD